VRFAVAVRAEEHALGELGFDPFPAAQNAISRDGEILGPRIRVVELEYTRRDGGTAALAERPQLLDRPPFALAAKRDFSGLVGPRYREVPGPVTIRAEQVALRSFLQESRT
jgi:hypothetical protein